MSYSATRLKYPLSTRKIHKKVFESNFSTILALLLIVPSIAFFTYSGDSYERGYLEILVNFFSIFKSWDMQALLGIILLWFGASYLNQLWYFKTYYYDFTPEHIIIRKGTIARNEVLFAYDKIQDIYISQDTLDRVLGLYDVHLSSATFTSSQLAHIDGVDKNAAEGIKAELLARINK